MQKHFIWTGLLAVAGFAVWALLTPAPVKDDAQQSAAPAGAPLATVVVPELVGNAAIGKQIFDAKCAACHGPHAAGQDWVAPPLVHRIYEPSHHSDVAFLLAVRNGVRSHHWRFGSMPPVEGLTDGDVAMVVDYVRTLQRANGIE